MLTAEANSTRIRTVGKVPPIQNNAVTPTKSPPPVYSRGPMQVLEIMQSFSGNWIIEKAVLMF